MRNDPEFCFYGRKFDDSHAGTLEDDDAVPPPPVVKPESNADIADTSMSQDTQDSMHALNVPGIAISSEPVPMDVDVEPKPAKTVGEEVYMIIFRLFPLYHISIAY